jgi:pilus assembly protein CpaF
MIIQISQEGAAPRTVTLATGEAVVGKHADCQVVLPDPKVSRRHAKLSERDGKVFVQDLGSTNGTHLGGRAVERETAIEVGQVLEIGPYELKVLPSPPKPAAVTQAAPDDDSGQTRILDAGTQTMASPSVATQPPVAEPVPAKAPPPAVPKGFGPLDPLFADESISEIMVNGPEEILVERRGVIEQTDLRFDSAQALRELIAKMAADVGRVFDERQPLLDARLRDGSRINGVLPPLAVRGPYLTIRRFPSRRLNAEQLVENGSITQPMFEFLRGAVAARVSVLVSGGTGSGKTTLLAALCAFIAPRERVVTIEDAAELRLPLPHVLPLESRPPDASGLCEVTIRDLVRNALRMRPDRIVVGEVRGAEALDMLQAMNTGHEGSLSTVHANSPREALQRLETLVLFAGTELPQRAVREQIVGAIPLIVHIARASDGRRRVTSIEEVTGLESGQFTMGDVFHVDESGKGACEPTGYVPRVRERILQRGFPVDNAWFQPAKKK